MANKGHQVFLTESQIKKWLQTDAGKDELLRSLSLIFGDAILNYLYFERSNNYKKINRGSTGKKVDFITQIERKHSIPKDLNSKRVISIEIARNFNYSHLDKDLNYLYNDIYGKNERILVLIGNRLDRKCTSRLLEKNNFPANSKIYFIQTLTGNLDSKIRLSQPEALYGTTSFIWNKSHMQVCLLDYFKGLSKHTILKSKEISDLFGVSRPMNFLEGIPHLPIKGETTSFSYKVDSILKSKRFQAMDKKLQLFQQVWGPNLKWVSGDAIIRESLINMKEINKNEQYKRLLSSNPTTTQKRLLESGIQPFGVAIGVGSDGSVYFKEDDIKKLVEKLSRSIAA